MLILGWRNKNFFYRLQKIGEIRLVNDTDLILNNFNDMEIAIEEFYASSTKLGLEMNRSDVRGQPKW